MGKVVPYPSTWYAMPNEVTSEEYLCECNVLRSTASGIPYLPIDPGSKGLWRVDPNTSYTNVGPNYELADGIALGYSLGFLNFETFRDGTDRNKLLIAELKDLPRIYKPKTVLVRDICKSERYYDYNKFRWRWRPVFTEVVRLLPQKRNLAKLLQAHSRRQSNDLSFSQVRYPHLGQVNNITVRLDTPGWNVPSPAGILPSSVQFQLNGSVFGFFPLNGLSYSGALNFDGDIGAGRSLRLFDWGPELPPYDFNANSRGLAGWPGSYADVDNLFAEFSDAIDDGREKCLSRLYTKIKNAKLDLATDLAEISQTIGLISDMAVKLGTAFIQLKSGKLLDALKSIVPTNRGEVSNVFLAYRYGVAPLMGDIQGAAEQLAERVIGLPRTMVRAKKSRTFRSSVDYGHFTVTIDTKIDVKYKVSYGLNGSETIPVLSSLGFTSPANVAWELVPFSFVVDWFLPIGNFLGSLSALDGYKVREIEETVFVKQNVFCDYRVVSTPSLKSIYSTTDFSFVWSCEKTKMRRQLLPSLPSLPLPRWRNPFTVGRALNALALLSQMVKGK